MIQQDLVPIQQGSAVNSKLPLPVPFVPSIKVSIQAQVTATATNVNAEVGSTGHERSSSCPFKQSRQCMHVLLKHKPILASTQAQANQARLMMERKQRLLNQGFISKVEFEQSRVDYQASNGKCPCTTSQCRYCT